MGEIKDAPWYVRFSWVAQDKDGSVWAYETRPFKNSYGNCWAASRSKVKSVFGRERIVSENWDKEYYQIETTPDGAVSIKTHRPEE
jgi:hypothetical protein